MANSHDSWIFHHIYTSIDNTFKIGENQGILDRTLAWQVVAIRKVIQGVKN